MVGGFVVVVVVARPRSFFYHMHSPYFSLWVHSCLRQVASKITSETLSMIAEAYCFAAIGLSVHEFDASQWCWSFIVVMILVLMIAR